MRSDPVKLRTTKFCKSTTLLKHMTHFTPGGSQETPGTPEAREMKNDFSKQILQSRIGTPERVPPCPGTKLWIRSSLFNKVFKLRTSCMLFDTFNRVFGATNPAEPGTKSSSSSVVTKPHSVLPYACIRHFGLALARTWLELTALKMVPPVNNITLLKSSPNLPRASCESLDNSIKWFAKTPTDVIWKQQRKKIQHNRRHNSLLMPGSRRNRQSVHNQGKSESFYWSEVSPNTNHLHSQKTQTSQVVSFCGFLELFSAYK